MGRTTPQNYAAAGWIAGHAVANSALPYRHWVAAESWSNGVVNLGRGNPAKTHIERSAPDITSTLWHAFDFKAGQGQS